MPRAFWMASSFSSGAVHRRTLSCRPPCLLRHDGDALLGAHDAQQLRPAHVYAFLFQHIFGDGHDPVGQYGQMEVGLGAFVGLVVYRAYVKIQFQSLECLFHGSLITSQAGTPAYQVKLPDVLLSVLVEGCPHFPGLLVLESLSPSFAIVWLHTCSVPTLRAVSGCNVFFVGLINIAAAKLHNSNQFAE